MRSWKFSNTHLIGRAHIANGIPCQDFSKHFQNDHFNISVLSDGCGSSSHSDIGAQIVVNNLIKLITEEFDSIVTMDPITSRKYILENINDQLQSKADDLSVSIKELNATLLFVAVKDNQELLMGHLGDGFIGSIQGSRLEIKSLEEKTEEVNGTVYTTTPNAFASFNLRKGTLKDYEGFILLSDGSADALVDSRKPFEKIFIQSVAKIMEFISANEKETSQNAIEEYVEKVRDHINSGDDCSLAVMVLEDTKVEKIITYNVPKPTVKASDEKRPVYQFKKEYQHYYDYLKYKYEDTPIDFIDKMTFSRLMDYLKNLGTKPLEIESYLHIKELENHIKHIIYDGY